MSKHSYNCNDGYYRINNVYRDRPLAYCPYGSCGVIETKDALYLKSYTTFVIKYDKKMNLLQCSGTYSRTTIKHIIAFTREICGNNLYHIMKKCYQDNVAYNPNTGEIVELNGNFDVYGFQGIKKNLEVA